MAEPAPAVFANSFGSVGSKTFVRACLGRDGCAALAPAHGHPPRPPPSWPGPSRVVHLFGDPWNPAISFFGRRGGGRVPGRARKRGRDLFRLEKRCANRCGGPLPCSVLFVRFEDRRDHLPAILDSVGLPAEAARRVPPLVPRSSDRTAPPDAIRAGLDALYGGLRARLPAEPPVFVRPAAPGA